MQALIIFCCIAIIVITIGLPLLSLFSQKEEDIDTDREY